MFPKSLGIANIARAVVIGTTLALPLVASAQDTAKLNTDITFYGDNTEFFNRFRDGETLFGAAGTVAADLTLGEDVTFKGGLFFNHRFGSARFLEQWRPVLSLSVKKGISRFTMGTLDTVPREGVGADLVGPHGLIPPLQVETLAFTRPYEAGLQWQLDSTSITQDAWVSWQRLNTASHRERFDAGLRGRIPITTKLPVSFAYQLHHVHEGGQLFDSGPVSDSFAGGPGVIVEPRIDFFDAFSVEAYTMWSKHVANRAVSDGSSHGHGLFVRAAAIKNGWRGHIIAWQACDWLKEEGDLNYGSRLQEGTIFHPTRHYGEVGIAKAFYEADGVVVEGAARYHRVEKDYAYSFRVVAYVDFDVPLLHR